MAGKETTTIRVKRSTQETLQALARETGAPIQELVAQAVTLLWRQHIIGRSNAAYAELRRNPDAWQEELAERELQDVTVADGLEVSE